MQYSYRYSNIYIYIYVISYLYIYCNIIVCYSSNVILSCLVYVSQNRKKTKGVMLLEHNSPLCCVLRAASSMGQYGSHLPVELCP